jgi:hypothetical protein
MLPLTFTPFLPYATLIPSIFFSQDFKILYMGNAFPMEVAFVLLGRVPASPSSVHLPLLISGV